jgi:hypothetical protein
MAVVFPDHVVVICFVQKLVTVTEESLGEEGREEGEGGDEREEREEREEKEERDGKRQQKIMAVIFPDHVVVICFVQKFITVTGESEGGEGGEGGEEAAMEERKR